MRIFKPRPRTALMMVFVVDMVSVPTEMTPFTYQIVLDLSIPVADRCQAAMQTIESTVATVFGQQSQLRMLPTIDLSAIDPQTGMPGTPCRQSPYRALDATGVAQQIKLAAASWPEQHQRYYMLYFNNLRAALPAPLLQSFSDFSDTIVTPSPPGDFQAFLWPWGPMEMTSSYPPWHEQVQPPPQVWSAADDPTQGRVVIVRQDLRAGKQTVQIVDAGATGPLTITNDAPVGAEVELWSLSSCLHRRHVSSFVLSRQAVDFSASSRARSKSPRLKFVSAP